MKRTELNDLAFQRGNTEQSLKDRKQKGARLTREMATIDKIIKDKVLVTYKYRRNRFIIMNCNLHKHFWGFESEKVPKFGNFRANLVEFRI